MARKYVTMVKTMMAMASPILMTLIASAISRLMVTCCKMPLESYAHCPVSYLYSNESDIATAWKFGTYININEAFSSS